MPEAAAVAAAAGPAARISPRALVFRLGGRLLATPGGAGGRVVEIASLTRVPTAPAWVLGLANDHGTVLAVVDARPLLGLPAAPWPRPFHAQVVGGEELRLALAVEEVLGFEPYRPEGLRPLPGNAPDGLGGLGLGLLGSAAGEAVLIDLPAVVEALRAGRFEERDPAVD